jgi:hypothetical protein
VVVKVTGFVLGYEVVYKCWKMCSININKMGDNSLDEEYLLLEYDAV